MQRMKFEIHSVDFDQYLCFEDSTTFLTLSNSVGCLSEEYGKKPGVSVKELFYWSSSTSQPYARLGSPVLIEALVSPK